jgi:uncharacterized Fe-S cluster protein YjdI
LWDENNCRHAGACLKSLPMDFIHDKKYLVSCTKPDVFKDEDGQFVIELSKASEKEVENVVNQRPSRVLVIKD